NRPVQPAPEQPTPHRRRAAIHDSGERELRSPAEARLDLEITARRDVHDQRVVAPLAAQAAKMRHLRTLGVVHVLEKTARRADRVGYVLRVVTCEISNAELLAQQTPAGVLVEMPRRASAHARQLPEPTGRGDVFRDEQLRGLQALELGRERVGIRELVHAEAAAGEVEPREADLRAELYRREVPRLFVVEERG